MKAFLHRLNRVHAGKWCQVSCRVKNVQNVQNVPTNVPTMRPILMHMPKYSQEAYLNRQNTKTKHNTNTAAGWVRVCIAKANGINRG